MWESFINLWPAANRRSLGLTAPIALLVAVSIALVLGAIYYAVHAQNKSVVAQSEKFAQSLLELEENRIKGTVKDWTWWDEARTNLVPRVNEIWAAENLANFLTESLDISWVFVIDAAGKTTYAMVDGESVSTDLDMYLIGNLAELIKRAQDAPMDEPIAHAGFFRSQDGGVQMVAASALTPEFPSGKNFERAPRAVMLFTLAFDEVRLQKIARDFGLENLRIAEPGGSLSEASFNLSEVDGASAGILTWDVASPGETFFSVLVAPIIIACPSSYNLEQSTA
ncbi:MAG: hypothetical protein O3B21_07720 [Proteobacteria bacterium]|nr:hypothetical protein [Pseudomonadota bacterium]MDA1357115.1 hypothetical protein [Pseudomonadota bacterium]